ncbi:hypothetical protein PAMA_020742 [Pampus argenteus]
MYDYLLVGITCLCFLSSGFHAEECRKAVLAKRDTVYASAGDSLSLVCEVQHCGDTWTGGWIWRNSTDEGLSAVKDDRRHRLTNVSLSANKTQLLLRLLSVNKSDEGSYGCKVTWSQGETHQGHLTYVNITAAVPSQRNTLYRSLVCIGAFLCLPIILILARCLSSFPRGRSTHAAQPIAAYRALPHPAPQPPPRCPVPQKRSTSSHKARPKPQQKTEVVYADISKDALSQNQSTRASSQSTVYSSLNFQSQGKKDSC